MNAYNWTELAAYAKPVEPTKAEVDQAKATEAWVRENTDVVTFLVDYKGDFSFLHDMRRAFGKYGKLTERQLAAVQKCMRIDAQNKAVVAQIVQAPAKTPVAGLDLSKVPAGRYAVPGGETRLKVLIQRGTGNWQGFVFVKDAAEYGQGQRYGMQRPGKAYEGQIVDALKTIVADPKAASIAYGRLVGRCGVCGRPLEDEQSVAAGIGPICAGKF